MNCRAGLQKPVAALMRTDIYGPVSLFKSPARFHFLDLFLSVQGLFEGVGMSFINLICSIDVLFRFFSESDAGEKRSDSLL